MGLGGAGAALGLGGTVQRAAAAGASLTDAALILAAVLAVGALVVVLVGMSAVVVALFCKREAPFRRLRQLIEALRSRDHRLEVEHRRRRPSQ
jgi:hypothetical protein